MWNYVKNLEYPVNLKCKDFKMAKCLLEQYGGQDSELSNALRYLNLRYTMPTGKAKALLTDIAAEELSHLEIIGTMIYQLLSNATLNELKTAGLPEYYSNHGQSLMYKDASGFPWTSSYIQSKENFIADLYDALAGEQRSIATYENLITIAVDPEIRKILGFLRGREKHHFKLIKQLIRELKKELKEKNKKS